MDPKGPALSRFPVIKKKIINTKPPQGLPRSYSTNLHLVIIHSEYWLKQLHIVPRTLNYYTL
jgi:hypothetical protein